MNVIIKILKKAKHITVDNIRIGKLTAMSLLPYHCKSNRHVSQVLLFGAYGNTNIGDNLVFFALRKYFPDSVEIRLSCRERVSSFDYGVNTFFLGDRNEWLHLMKSADLVLLGGGGLFEYYRKATGEGWMYGHLKPLVYARHYGKKYAIVGIGCNNMLIRNRILRYIFKRVANDAAFIITRDQKSKEGFVKNGVGNKNLTFCFDPVFTYMPVKKCEGKQLTMTVGFLIWPFYMWPHFHSATDISVIKSRMSVDKLKAHERFVVELRKCIEELQEKHIKCIFPVFHFSDKILHDEMGIKSEYPDPLFDDYFSAISKCDIIVTMRYHGQITSLLCGKPIISILVQEKMEALAENLGIKDSLSIDIDNFSASDTIAMINRVYSDYNNMVKTLTNKVVSMQEFVNQTYIRIFNKVI